MPRAKTFKSEYHLGGAVKVSFPVHSRTGETGVRIHFHGSDCVMEFEMWDRKEMREYLEENTSSYQAEKVMDYILSQIKIEV